ncbi:hypothetical protein LINPERHAP2_LOCUS12101, partial [Linum perenne]
IKPLPYLPFNAAAVSIRPEAAAVRRLEPRAPPPLRRFLGERRHRVVVVPESAAVQSFGAESAAAASSLCRKAPPFKSSSSSPSYRWAVARRRPLTAAVVTCKRNKEI